MIPGHLDVAMVSPSEIRSHLSCPPFDDVNFSVGRGGLNLTVNGESRDVAAGRDRSLLGVLRDDLGLTGTKYGCGDGDCGACSVLVDGVATLSCITPASSVSGRVIRTVEGLSNGESLHPVQEAFAECNAFQCGYCTPGFIVSAVALLGRNPDPSQHEIQAGLNGNICRCGAYKRIIEAVQLAAKKQKGNSPS